MEARLRFAGARVALDAQHTTESDILVARGRVLALTHRTTSERAIHLDGHLVLPALVNAHDHLEFNLFPRIGHGPYGNATEWANEIYRPHQSPIREHLQVPKHLRYRWGALKNLISGVGTVAHHNAYCRMFSAKFPVRVVRRYGWAHSLTFGGDVAAQYRTTPPNWPFIIHAAEGSDETASREVDRLSELGVLSSRTLLVHALGVRSAMLERLRETRVSLVLCPTSNLFLFGAAPSRALVNSGIPFAIGSDSAITAAGDLLDECKAGRRLVGLSLDQIYNSVTSTSAGVLRLRNGAGTISPGGVADFLVVKDRGKSPAKTLASLRIEAVFVGGRLRIASARFLKTNDRLRPSCAHPLEVEGRGKFFTSLPVRRMLDATAKFIGKDVRLAGKRVHG